MPFTEAHPINIHDLAIESPNKPARRSWFDPSLDLSPVDLKIVAGSSNTIENIISKRVLGLHAMPTASQIDWLNDELLTARDVNNEFDSMRAIATLRTLGIYVELNEQEIKYIKSEIDSDYIDNLVRYKNLGFQIGHSEQLEDELASSLSVVAMDSSVATLADLKIIDFPLEIKQEYITEFMEYAKELRHPFYKNGLLKYYASLAIIASDGVTLGEKGYELIYNKNSTDLNTTPPMPVVRNF